MNQADGFTRRLVTGEDRWIVFLVARTSAGENWIAGPAGPGVYYELHPAPRRWRSLPSMAAAGDWARAEAARARARE